MKTGTLLATTLFAITSFPLLGQQSPSTNQPSQSDSTTQQTPSGTETSTPRSSFPTPAVSAAEMSAINGELISKLDSKTAKAGDSIVVQTRSSAKTADGTEIPKGSKLVGHVIGAQPGSASENSQVALVFDHIDLKNGQSMPVHSQIQSISPAGGTASASGSAAMSAPPAGSSANPGASGASGTPQSASASGGAPAQSSGPAPGTVVAKTGQIAISTTAVPGVLLANNAPGQQDPRMTKASSILLGAKQDVQLDSGTQMVVGVSATGAGTQ